ncbi:MAG TPA: hypothetical protein VGM74_10640 [Burkholderiaceae bacterium]|jgi:hypothetical protein
MVSTHDTHHWLSRFAVRLMALRPDISFRSAVARAASAHAHAKSLTPEDAAQIDAEARDPDRAGAASRGAPTAPSE